MRRLEACSDGFSAAFDALLAARGARSVEAEAVAARIVADVRARGFAAVADHSLALDGHALTPENARIGEDRINAAFAACDPSVIAALELAARRIADFHARQVPADERFTDADGLTLGWRWTPVDAAGLYAPGGRAAYPSSVLMNAVPAKAAGVARLAMVTPPGRLDENPAILAAAKIAGVDEIWGVGGAQAIAALAHGADPIAPVDVIVGPGNAYVAAAKKLVFGDVGIDSVAGPSEIFVIADAGTPARWIAADLLSQAEHDEDAQAVLITNDAAYADAVAAAVEALLAEGRAAASARTSWERHGAIVRVARLEDACALIDRAAPEHVEIAVADPEPLAARIRHAGALFLGRHAPEALGDYVAGPNHVLPTERRARYASGLSTQHFMKRTTLVGADAGALARIGPAASRLAMAEGLPAHAASIDVRFEP